MLSRSRGDFVAFAMPCFLRVLKFSVTDFLSNFGLKLSYKAASTLWVAHINDRAMLLSRVLATHDAGRALGLRRGLILRRSRAARFSHDL